MIVSSHGRKPTASLNIGEPPGFLENPSSCGVSVKNRKVYCSNQELNHIPMTYGVKYAHTCDALDLSHNRLKNLDGIDMFWNVSELNLDNNLLDDSFELPFMPSLHTLTLNNNKIVNTKNLIELVGKKCPNLRYLSLLGNPACPNELVEMTESDYEKYRRYVIGNLQDLKFLDSKLISEAERAEAVRVNMYMKVIDTAREKGRLRKGVQGKIRFGEEDLNDKQLNSCPASAKVGGDIDKGEWGKSTSKTNPNGRRISFGKTTRMYSGHDSEGNRFISNDEL
eukprot:Nk52_evm29s2192 gene=Nk52_evmTU29s2192